MPGKTTTPTGSTTEAAEKQALLAEIAAIEAQMRLMQMQPLLKQQKQQQQQPTNEYYDDDENEYDEEVIEEVWEEEEYDEEEVHDEELLEDDDEPLSYRASPPKQQQQKCHPIHHHHSHHHHPHFTTTNSQPAVSSPPMLKPAATPSGNKNNLFGDMLAAVGQHKQRVETGNTKQRAAGLSTSTKSSTTTTSAARPTTASMDSLASMVAKAASSRESRLAQGGAQKMTVIKNTEEYKVDFSNVVLEAAKLGRLTRLREHVVEAVAKEKTVSKDTWQSKGLMAIEWRTNHMNIIHEAAALGNETKMREHVVVNYEADPDEDIIVDEATQYKRMQALAKADGASKVEHYIALQKLLDSEDGTRGLVRPMYMYNDITKVVLPKGRLPKFNPSKGKQQLAQMKSPLTEISNDVIRKALDRMARMNQKDAQPHVRKECHCGYCDAASPFQTFAYRVVEGRVKGMHIPKELHKELNTRDGKKYKVRGKGGKTRVTRAIKADADGEIDKEHHYYIKLREKEAQAERDRIARETPRVRRGRVSRPVSGGTPSLSTPSPSKSLTSSATATPLSKPRTPRTTSAAAVTPRKTPSMTSSSSSSMSVSSCPATREQLKAEIAAMEREIQRRKQMEEAQSNGSFSPSAPAQIAAGISTPSPRPRPHPRSSATGSPCAPQMNSSDTKKKKNGLMGRLTTGRKKK